MSAINSITTVKDVAAFFAHVAHPDVTGQTAHQVGDALIPFDEPSRVALNAIGFSLDQIHSDLDEHFYYMDEEGKAGWAKSAKPALDIFYKNQHKFGQGLRNILFQRLKFARDHVHDIRPITL